MVLVVNLDEFSELCGRTPETMRDYIRAVEGEPAWLIERGTRGRGYRIEAEGGLAWWKALQAADENASAERLAQLQQLRFELLGDSSGSEEELSLSGKQRREEYAAEFERIRLAKMMGKLVDTEELVPALMAAVVESRRRLGLVPGEFAALTGMSQDEVKPLGAMIEKAVDDFVTTFTTAAQPKAGP